MDRLDNKQKIAGLGLALAGAVALWYLLTRQSKKDGPDSEEQQAKQLEDEQKNISENKEQVKKSEEKKSNDQVDIDRLVSQFRAAYVEGTDIININTLQQIMNISVKMSIQEYSEYTVQNRRDRRQKRSEGDYDSYFNLLNEYCDKL